MIDTIIIFIILFALSGFFSGVEAGLISISKIKAESLVHQNKKGAKQLLKLKQKPRMMLVTLLLGNNIVNVAASAIAAVLATNIFGSAGVGIATAIITFFILVFGEIIPKSYCTQHAEKVALFSARIILFLQIIFFPVVYPLDRLTKYALKITSKTKSKQISEEEIKLMIDVGFGENLIKKKQKQVLESAFVLDDLTVKEIMTPWKSVFTLPADIPIKEAILEIDENHHSRIPLYKKSKGKISIVGFAHVKDLLPLSKSIEPISKVAKKALVVRESLIIVKLLKEFQDAETHLAIVKDKKGKAIGIVTFEDILEEIVGEIRDETDNSHKKKRHMLYAHGNTSIEHINESLGINLPQKYRTISEFLIDKFQKIPPQGEELILRRRNLKIIILDKDSDIIYKMKISRIK